MRNALRLSLTAVASIVAGCEAPSSAPSVTPLSARAPVIAPVIAPTVAQPSPAQAPIAPEPPQPNVATDSAVVAEADEPEAPPPPSEVTLRVNGERYCTFRVRGRALRAQCDSGSMLCREAARGRVTRAETDDLVSICTFSETHDEFVVVSTDDGVRFAADAMGEVERMCADYETHVVLIEAGRDPLRALLVQARNCAEPGKSMDADTLYHWSHNAMSQVADAQFECIFLETRLPPANGGAGYSCIGTYLVASAAGSSTINVVGHRIRVRQSEFGEARLMRDNGHIQRRIRLGPHP